jgi:hypothetical protein
MLLANRLDVAMKKFRRSTAHVGALLIAAALLPLGSTSFGQERRPDELPNPWDPGALMGWNLRNLNPEQQQRMTGTKDPRISAGTHPTLVDFRGAVENRPTQACVAGQSGKSNATSRSNHDENDECR